MAASSSSFFPWIACQAQRPPRSPHLGRALDEHWGRAEDADPHVVLRIEDEDDIDDLLPWVGPDNELTEAELTDDWSDEDDPSLAPFVSDEDEKP
jgi:hypothetical protein